MSAHLNVRVQPKASRNHCFVTAEGQIRIALTAPPVDGAANEALIRFIADLLGVPKRTVQLVGGGKSRDKTVAIAGLEYDAVVRRLLSEG